MRFIKLTILIIFLLTNCQGQNGTVKTVEQKTLEQKDKLTIEDLELNWKEVSSCNCLFAKTDDKYWRKELIFARDSVRNYGIIKIGKRKEAILIPISTPLTQKVKGQEWIEVYSNDTLTIILNGRPIKSQILRMYSYDVNFEMVLNGETINDVIIGHCRY
jgi:hypothetical protein